MNQDQISDILDEHIESKPFDGRLHIIEVILPKVCTRSSNVTNTKRSQLAKALQPSVSQKMSIANPNKKPHKSVISFETDEGNKRMK